MFLVRFYGIKWDLRFIFMVDFACVLKYTALIDRDVLAKMFWKRVQLRQYEMNITAKRVQEETEQITGKVYRLTETKCRNVLPDTYTICVLAQILKTTTDYLLGFIDDVGSITANEQKILASYREYKRFKTIIDNLL